MDNRNKNVRSHSDAEAFQYGFSKDVTRNKAKTKRKTKKLNHMKIRVVGGVIAGLLGVLIGLALFGLWYKDYLLNQITYETTDANQVATIIDENGDTIALNEVMESTKFTYVQDTPVKNFLLIGIDSRSSKYSKDGKVTDPTLSS